MIPPVTSIGGGRAPAVVSVDSFQVLLSIASRATPFPGTYPTSVALPASQGLGTFPIPTQISPNAFQIARPPGVNWIRIDQVNGQSVLLLQVQGDQTGTFYMSRSAAGGGGATVGSPCCCAITQAQDTSLTISAALGATGSVTLQVSGFADAAGPYGGRLPWLTPRSTLSTPVRALGAGTGQNMILAANGFQVFVHTVIIEVDDVAAGAGFNTLGVRFSGGGQFIVQLDSSGIGRMPFDAKGLASAFNQGIDIFNNDAAIHSGQATVHYTQIG
jgi:hypothetical protein